MKKINLEIDIKNKNDFVSPYNDNTLEPDLKEYILNELVGYDDRNKININIITKLELTDEEKEKYIKILKKEFKECLIDLQIETKNSNLKRLSLLLIGVISIFIDYKFGNTINGIIDEIIVIVGWVSIWELVYSILFTALSRRKLIRRYKQIISSNIKFK